jgi:beta-1,4-mannosyltransferase
VKDGINGYTFKSSDELSEQIVKWFEGFPDNNSQNRIAASMRTELEKFQKQRWETNWNLKAKAFFE